MSSFTGDVDIALQTLGATRTASICDGQDARRAIFGLGGLPVHVSPVSTMCGIITREVRGQPLAAAGDGR